MPAARDDDDRTDPGSRQGRGDPVRKASPDGRGGEFGFDFDAFERSEAEAASRNNPPRAPIAERPPERRTIIPRNWLPPGDAVIETRPIGNMTVVSLRGRINESFRGAELGQSLHGIVVFDLSQVDRISSFGVKGWLQMLEQARFTHCYFFRCSEAVINQVTMMRNFCGTGRIHSLLVPYLCGDCGEEFNVVYEAVGDRESILGRSPVPVECPRCSSAAKMADDPWAYLAIDDHLLEDVPADLDQVLEHLTQIQRVDPIEKFVSDDETRVRINVPLDARLRLGRALTGLEGRVVFDLTPRPELSSNGAQRLVEAIRELDAEVTEVWIDGATNGLIDALLADPPPRTWISTAWVVAVSPDTGIRRPVLVDVRKKRQSLLRGEVPPVDAGWARGSLTFEHADALFQAARHLQPPHRAAATPTPAPISPMPYGTGPTRTPTHTASHIHPGHTHPGSRPMPYSNPHITSAGFPAVQQQAAPPPRSLIRSPLFVWQLTAFIAVTMLLAAFAFTGVFVWAYAQFAVPQPSAPPVTTSQLPAVPAGEGWDGTGGLPPAWIDVPLVVDDAGVRGTGVGHGATMEQAVEASRAEAVYHIVQHLAETLARSSTAAAIGADPGPAAAPQVTARLIGDVGTWATPARAADAVKVESDGSYTVATQYGFDAATLQRVVDYYSNTAEFRGLTVGRRFPYRDADGLVVVKLESWFRGANPGDPVLEIDHKPIVTLEDFLRLTQEAWSATPEGGRMTLYVSSNGRRSPVEFVRAPANNNRPQPEQKIELLPLELGR
ncbi:MAG: hypothetical protein R3F59_37780 [Myxococcota bacterium]